MGKALEAYLDSVRVKAREKAAVDAKVRVQGRRDAERTLRAQGVKQPFDDWNLADFQRISKVEFEVLSTNPLFSARFEAVSAEIADEVQSVREAEDTAVARAVADVPADVVAADRHERERALLASRLGFMDEEDLKARAPDAVKAQFAEATTRQEKEIHAISK